MDNSRTIYEFFDFRADGVNKTLSKGGEIIQMTPKVFDTLIILLENAPNLVEKDVLMERIWHDRFVEESNLTFNIKMLRKALGDEANNPKFIETIPRRGYRFIAEVKIESEQKFPSNNPQTEFAQPEKTLETPSEKSKFRKRNYFVFGILIIFLSLFAGLTFFYRNLNFNTKQSFEQINSIRITTSGKTFYAIVSPDGKYIIHVKVEDGKQSLWIRQTDQTRDIEIVSPLEGKIYGLSVSPDSKSVYYTLGQENNADAILYQVPILGGVSKQILSNIDSGISFSSDGREFIFYRTNPGQGLSQLILANLDGTQQKVIAEKHFPETFETEFGNPVWKAHERKILAIAASNSPDAKCDIVEIEIETGEIKPFLNVQWKDIQQIGWLKNSQSLLAVAYDEESNSRQIFHINPKTGRYRKVTADPNNYRGISLTDDEKVLITTQTEQVTRLLQTNNKNAETTEEIYSEKGNITGNEGLAWTPENELIFSLGEQNTDNIMIRDGAGIRPLSINPNGNRHPTVCQDQIIFAANFALTQPNSIRLFRIDKNGKNLQRLTSDDEENEMFPHCSAKSDWIVFQRGSETPTLWKIPLSSGKTIQLTDSFSYQPAVSPDGKSVAIYSLDNFKWSINVVSIEDGKLLKQFPISGKSKLRHLRWTTDGKNIAYSDTRHQVSNIWLQPIEGGEPKQLTNFTSGTIFYFDWSPDGKNLAFVQGTATTDVFSIADVR